MSDADKAIITKIKHLGVDYGRLRDAMSSRDAWGQMVNSYVYLTVLGVVEDAMRKDHESSSNVI